jgi:hypothetical protein
MLGTGASAFLQATKPGTKARWSFYGFSWVGMKDWHKEPFYGFTREIPTEPVRCPTRENVSVILCM